MPRHAESAQGGHSGLGISRQPVLARVAQSSTRSASPNAAAPLTPKVAASAAKTSHQAFAATPPTRRGTSGSGSKDEYTAAPPATFLVNNVTPRSGSRQSRVDSTNTTPVGTPVPDKAEWDAKSAVGAAQGDADSKFFYASDAKSPPLVPQRPTSLGQTKQSSFFYASGPPSPGPAGFTPVLGPPDALPSKFIYANGTPDVRPPPVTSPSASTVSTYSMAKAPPRPVSPIKNPSFPPPQVPRGPALGQAINRAQVASAPPLAPGFAAKRRISIDAAPRGLHSRNRSIDSQTVLKTLAGDAAPCPPGSPQHANPPAGIASMMQAADDMADAQDFRPDDLASPTKSTMGDVSELVANARRERKVQDLEITNASLEAINRTLERQLRKQTAELRRYRRLSRSGRFSLASAASSRVPSATYPDEPDHDLPPLSYISDDDDDFAHDGFEDSLAETESETESSVSGAMSPGAKASREARRRARDEKRLQLDLSQHRQMLVDSQKMNQSLKRCLNWTEELIREGNKALEYSVGVGDVEFGGRVLSPHDDEEHDAEYDVENEDSVVGGGGDVHDDVKGPPDRDSGVDLPPAG